MMRGFILLNTFQILTKQQDDILHNKRHAVNILKHTQNIQMIISLLMKFKKLNSRK
jgi:hypothetical protein